MFYDKKWTLKHKGKIETDELGNNLNISGEISQILKNRGIFDEYNAKVFMDPSLKYLHDPFLMKDMDKGVKRIKEAIENNENIWIYGDYDVDGVSSTSILCLYFESINYPVNYYIPNRLEEGYGINEDAIQYLYEQGCNLIVSVDCGITSVKEVNMANELGIDVIITDHHECQDEIPNALAVINPHQEDCNYPFKLLCGCGVAFKLIQALTPKDVFKETMYDYLEVVTLATICDIVSLVGENRIIVKNGLKLMRDGRNIGLKALIKVCGIESDNIGSSHIGFSVGPRINAAGRLGYSKLGVKLFTCKDEPEAMEIATNLEEKNNERQMIEAKMYKEAEDIILSDDRYKEDKVMVIANEGWQHGVIGIVASKLTEKYYKPTILLTIEEGEATGSARSIKGFSIFDALCNCSQLFKKFGGHEQAAGLSLDANNVDELRESVNKFADNNLNQEDLIENINVEFELEEDIIGFELLEELHKLEPFGLGNPSPRFIVRDMDIINIMRMGKDKQHIKFTVKKDSTYECIGFNMAYIYERFSIGDKIDLLFQLDENTYMGKRKIQFLLKDIRLSYPKNVLKDKKLSGLLSNIKPSDINCPINYNINIKGNKNINIFDYIKENILIITNSINGFCKAISDISLTDIEYDINFNEIGNYSDKVNLIFFPNIDKIDLTRYNSIILYDYLYSLEEYSYLYQNIEDENNIIKYYNDEDLEYIKNIINNSIPNRDEFITVYKILMQYQEISLDINNIKSMFKINLIKLFTTLNVFKELYLLNYSIINTDGNSKLEIKLLPKPDKKLDLNNSQILQNLNKLKEKYAKSY